jgi:capsular exopolysaccharide synthesis family protein
MNTGQNSQSLPQGKADNQSFEIDEGGLNLNQVIGSLRRRALLVAGVTAVVVSGTVVKVLMSESEYQAKFEILTQPVTVSTEVTSSVPGSLSERQQKVATVDETFIQVLRSPKVLMPVVEKLRSQYPNLTYNSLIRNLQVKSNLDSREEVEGKIIEVTYHNDDPTQVRDVLNSISEAYLNYSQEQYRSQVRQGIEFVNEQLPELRSQVNTKQEQLQELRQQNNLLNPATRSDQLSERLNSLKQQRQENEIQLEEARALHNNLQQELSQQPVGAAASSALSDNSSYQNLLTRLQEIDAQIAQKSALLGGASPELQNLRQQRQNLLPLLRQEGKQVRREAANRIELLQERRQILNQNINSLNQQINQMSGTLREYTNIQRELQIATENLNQFLTKRSALRIDAAQGEQPWSLLVPTTQPEPAAGNVPQTLALGTILGLLLGGGAALLVDKLSNVVYTSREVKELTKLPLLGTIPLEEELGESSPAINSADLTQADNDGQGELQQNNGHQLQPYKALPFFEAFRSLCTSVRLLGSDYPISSFVITSAVPAEGKSTVAAHLAHAAATMGQRVLLVDAELRRPRLHNRVGVMNTYGLADLISSGQDYNNFVQRSPLDDNLFVLTAGSIPPDPVRLLASHKMQDIMQKVQAEYDLVIYDSPPCLGFADTRLIASQTNGVALVAGLGKLKRSELEQALNEFELSGTPVLGTIANGAKDSSSRYSDYYDRYYGGDDEDEPRDPGNGQGNNGSSAPKREEEEVKQPAQPLKSQYQASATSSQGSSEPDAPSSGKMAFSSESPLSGNATSQPAPVENGSGSASSMAIPEGHLGASGVLQPNFAQEESAPKAKAKRANHLLTSLRASSIVALLVATPVLGSTLIDSEKLSRWDWSLQSKSSTADGGLTEASSSPATKESANSELNSSSPQSASSSPSSPKETTTETASSSPKETTTETASSSPKETTTETASNSATLASAAPAPKRSDFYYVVADYTSDRSLEQAQAIVPDAYLRNFSPGVQIQMGAFYTESDANRLVAQLKQQGVSASVHLP